MNEVRCLIVDDEPLAHRVIENYVKEFSFIRVVGKCRDGLEALELIKKEAVDLIFLDIQMPKLDGFRFLKAVKNQPLIILTTAYDDYALESYDFEVTDYLLKPFSFERFWKAFEKAQALLELRNLNSANETESLSPDDTAIFVKSEGKVVRVDFNKVLYVEAMGDYVKFVMAGEECVTHQSLTQIEERLPKNRFIRIHRSYIAAIGKIDFISQNEMKVGEQTIPIGKVYRNELMKRMNI